MSCDYCSQLTASAHGSKIQEANTRWSMAGQKNMCMTNRDEKHVSSISDDNNSNSFNIVTVQEYLIRYQRKTEILKKQKGQNNAQGKKGKKI